MPAVLGLDVGGTKLAAGVVDETGAVHGLVVGPTDSQRGPDDAIARLFELGRCAVAQSGYSWDDVAAVGIGCGGPLDSETGVVISPPHLPGWRDIPLAKLASEAFDRPAVLENDATAGAAGELRFGAGLGVQSFVYLTISTGIGGGVVVDGKVRRGPSGNGGEPGHVTIDWHGRVCRGCGRRGCLEAYASGTSIAERAQEAGMEGATAADVAAAALAGDPIATRVWDETCEALACGITSIVNLLEPELIVLGGGVMRTGEQLLGPVRALVERDVMNGSVAIVQSRFGDAVGVVGAAAVAYERAGLGITVETIGVDG